MITSTNKAIFIDKDGTLIPDIPYNVNPDLITLQPGAAQGLQLLQEDGFLIIIISNQSGVGRGYFKEKELIAVQRKIEQLLSEHSITLHGFYYCPHHPDASIKEYAVACDCRKPEAGMLLKAAADFKIDLQASWMIGDILNDVEAGKKEAAKRFLINNGGETEWIVNEQRTPDYTATNILEAALYITSQSKQVIRNEQRLASL